MVQFTEFARLQQYVAAFQQLIALQDRTPPQWRYFQTWWMQLYVRGMVAGRHVGDVRAQRLAELAAHPNRESAVELRLLREAERAVVDQTPGNRSRSRALTLRLSISGSKVRLLLSHLTIDEVAPFSGQ